MSNFGRIRPIGFWTTTSPLASAEVEQFDAVRPKLINASDGSTHSPTTQIVIGGQGLKVTGNFTPDLLTVTTGHTSVWQSGAVLNMFGGLNIEDGADLTVLDGAHLNVESGGEIDVESGGHLYIDGFLNARSGAAVVWQSSSTFEVHGTADYYGVNTYHSDATFTAGASITVAADGFGDVYGLVRVQSGGDIRVLSGGQSQILAGANFDVFGDETLHSGATLTVSGGAALAGSGTVTLTGDVTVSGGTLTVTNSPADFAGTTIVTVENQINIASGGTEHYAAGSAITGTAADASTRTITGPSKYSGNTAYRGVRYATKSPSTSTWDAHTADVFSPASTLPGTITWTLQDPPDTSFNCIVELSIPTAMFSGHTLFVTDATASFTFSLMDSLGTFYVYARFMFISAGIWRPLIVVGF